MQPSPVSDRKITQHVTQRLSSCGMRAPSRVTVNTVKGEVTLAGPILTEHLRQAIIKATRCVEGVRQVVDRMRLIPKRSASHGSPPGSHA